MVHIYNGILLTHKNEILPYVTAWMDPEGIMLSEISQKEKDKWHMISLKQSGGKQFYSCYYTNTEFILVLLFIIIFSIQRTINLLFPNPICEI